MKEKYKCPLCGSTATKQEIEVDDGCSCGSPYCRSHMETIVECDECTCRADAVDWKPENEHPPETP